MRNRAYDVLDVVNRIRNAGVLGYALVSEVTFSSRASRVIAL